MLNIAEELKTWMGRKCMQGLQLLVAAVSSTQVCFQTWSVLSSLILQSTVSEV